MFTKTEFLSTGILMTRAISMCVVKLVKEFETLKIKRTEAAPDLRIYVTKIKQEAVRVDYIWYFEDAPSRMKIKYVDSSEDIKVEFVNNKFYAGWINKGHKFYKRLCSG